MKKSSKCTLKESTCKICVHEDCNRTLVIGSRIEGEQEILSIVCSNISCRASDTIIGICVVWYNLIFICWMHVFGFNAGSIIVKKEDVLIYYECRSKSISPLARKHFCWTWLIDGPPVAQLGISGMACWATGVTMRPESRIFELREIARGVAIAASVRTSDRSRRP